MWCPIRPVASVGVFADSEIAPATVIAERIDWSVFDGGEQPSTRSKFQALTAYFNRYAADLAIQLAYAPIPSSVSNGEHRLTACSNLTCRQ